MGAGENNQLSKNCPSAQQFADFESRHKYALVHLHIVILQYVASELQYVASVFMMFQVNPV